MVQAHRPLRPAPRNPPEGHTGDFFCNSLPWARRADAATAFRLRVDASGLKFVASENRRIRGPAIGDVL
jgi:hypothetical protein